MDEMETIPPTSVKNLKVKCGIKKCESLVNDV